MGLESTTSAMPVRRSFDRDAGLRASGTDCPEATALRFSRLDLSQFIRLRGWNRRPILLQRLQIQLGRILDQHQVLGHRVPSRHSPRQVRRARLETLRPPLDHAGAFPGRSSRPAHRRAHDSLICGVRAALDHLALRRDLPPKLWSSLCPIRTDQMS